MCPKPSVIIQLSTLQLDKTRADGKVPGKEAIILQQVAGFDYTCRIGRITFSANRNNHTSLTCEIDSNKVSATFKSLSAFRDIQIIDNAISF